MAELITQRIRRNAAELRLHAIAEDPDELIERAEHAQLGYREFLDLLLESEVGVLEGRRYQARLKMAGLPHHKTLDDFDISFQPELDAKRLAELRSLRFVERKVGALILGPPGVGKSHISVGLGMEALARGYLVRYSTLDDLVRGLRHADALGKPPETPNDWGWNQDFGKMARIAGWITVIALVLMATKSVTHYNDAGTLALLITAGLLVVGLGWDIHSRRNAWRR